MRVPIFGPESGKKPYEGRAIWKPTIFRQQRNVYACVVGMALPAAWPLRLDAPG